MEADGQEVDEERRLAIVGKLKTAEERKEALANPTIDAQYKAAAVERARAKAAKAAELAGTTEADLSDF